VELDTNLPSVAEAVDVPLSSDIATISTSTETGRERDTSRMKSTRIKAPRSFVPGDKAIEDTFGHGTHVSALIMRVAPEAQIYVTKIAASGGIPQNHNIAELSNSSHSHSLSRIRKR
jgi:hypothetical protein